MEDPIDKIAEYADLDKNLSDDEIMNKTINRWKQEAEKEQEAENS